MSILDAFVSLGKNINKLGGKPADENEQGVVSEKFPELTLDIENDVLSKMTMKWKDKWETSEVKSVWEKKCEDNEKYWLGEQFNGIKGKSERPMVDNAIFEAVETYLPQITRRNPEPMVSLASDEESEQTEEYLGFAKQIQKKLADIADVLKLRLKLKKAGRHWAIYLIGVAKVGWDIDKDLPTVKIVRGKKLILDPEAVIEEDGYTGKYVGEYRKLEAGTMLKMLSVIGGEQDAEKIIKDAVKEDLGTDIQFIEWNTDQYICWTLGKDVLLKKKNPNWNYDKTEKTEAPYDEQGQPQLDETGQPAMVENEVKGFNHFPVPKLPYIFLSVFNLGKQPVDETSLVSQNLSNQDRINKRGKQIDKNADSMNNGMVVSLERAGMTKDQAKGVTTALQNGGVVAIPTGSVNEAISRMSANSLPADVYNDLVDTRNRLRDIFGTRGSSPAGIGQEKTVRGKYQVQTLDTDRIGGGVSEYLEQFADDIYNWFVQLLYVYDDKFAPMPNKPKLVVSVKEGSLLPKDSMTLANQAIELSSAGKMSVVDLYKSLDYANPEELAANVWLEVNAPEVLYGQDPRIQQVMESRQQAQQPEEKLPSQSISFKDLPPEGQAQMAAKVGINLNAEAIAAYNQNQKEQDRPIEKPAGETPMEQ